MNLTQQLEIAKNIQESIITKSLAMGMSVFLVMQTQIVINSDGVSLNIPEEIEKYAIRLKKPHFLEDCIEDGTNAYMKLNNLEEGEISDVNNI